jgi:hypothetical protein
MPWLHWLRYPLERRRGGPSLGGLDSLEEKQFLPLLVMKPSFVGGSFLSLATVPIYWTMLIKIAIGTWYYSATLFMQGNERDW